MNAQQQAVIALILVGLAPTASIFASFGSGNGLAGQLAWFVSKLWMLGLPMLWHLSIDKKALSWSKPTQGGFAMATGMGLVFALVMILAWFLIGESRVDKAEFRTTLEPFGLTVASTYIAGAIFWTVGNSVLEEYVFRWFLVEKGEVLSRHEKGISRHSDHQPCGRRTAVHSLTCASLARPSRR